MAAPDVARPSVDELAAEFIERHREGESPSIAEYEQRFPDLAEEIRELFPTIVKLEGLKHHLSGSSSGQAGVGLPGLSRLGDFRIVRELGRGGMGVVYEAEQESLRRRVALKVLGANIASSPKLLARFRREAESAARLHHTNIVPVFGVGEEHGVFFYAMQYIEGAPLSSIIQELRISKEPLSVTQIVERCGPSSPETGEHPSLSETIADPTTTDEEASPLLARVEMGDGSGTPQVVVTPNPTVDANDRAANEPASFIDCREAARMAGDLAGALHFAHLHGVLHRDVKPSNILVDRDGTVWITDFGLAKHDESGDLTRTGDVIGTLRYMSPEQLQGETDIRSDVYSLGLTLHELLAGQPAFDDNLKATLIQRKTAQPPPPLRSLNNRIPRDLETIVQKACTPLPADRYQTALELAEDLQRFVDERPIRARRLPALARTWRWMRRNPVVSSLSLLAATLLFAVGVAIVVGNYRTNKALDEAIAQQERAETNLASAVSALQEITEDLSARGVPQSLHVMFDEEGEESILQATPVTAADAELLKKLLRFFDEFAASNETDLTAETANIHLQIGEIHHRLGQLVEAEAAYGQAIETYEALQGEDPESPDVTIAIAETWNRIGTVQADRAQIWPAMLSHDAARELIETSPVAMEDDQGQYVLARTYTLFHQIYGRAGAADLFAFMWRGSDNRQRRGDPSRRPREGREGERDGDRDGRDGERGENRRREFRPTDAESGAPDEPPRERTEEELRRDEQRAEVAEAFPQGSISRAIEILEDLVERNPDNAVYKSSLAQSYRVDMIRARFHRSDDGEQEGAEPADRALEILMGLTGDYPDDPQYRYELADVLCMSVRWQRDLDFEERASRIKQAAKICAALTLAYPQVPSYQALAAVAERRTASIHRRNDDLEEALQSYQDAADTYRQLTQRFPTVSLYPIAQAQTMSEMADALYEAGEHDRAWEQSVSAVAVAEGCQHLRGDDRLFLGFLRRLTHQRDRLAAMKDRSFQPQESDEDSGVEL